ncbi:MAG: tetratricopeptide repeat protein, partial [Kiritimatiellia bacterium]
MKQSTEGLIALERLAPVLILALALLSYVNSFAAPFILDDAVAVTGNPDIGRLWPFKPGTRALVDLSFKINYAFCRLNVAGYHAVNVGLHVVAGLFLYGLVRRTLLRPCLRDRFGSSGTALALVIAAIWLVHPLQTQSVTYVAQRYESMMGLFALMSMYFFARGLDSTRPRWWFDGAIVACLLGMATKPVAVTVPVLILLYDWIFHSDTDGPPRVRWKVHLALFLTLGAHGMFLIQSAASSLTQGAYLTGTFKAWHYLLTQGEVILHYIRLAFIPYPLCMDYAWLAVTRLSEALIPLSIVILVVFAVIWGIFRRSPAAFAGAWFFVILAPTSSILPIDDICVEHRMYLPLAGIVVLAVTCVFQCLGRALQKLGASDSCGRNFRIFLAVSVVAVLSVLTMIRNRDYLSLERMTRTIVARRPENFRQHITLSSLLLSEGRYQEAEQVARNILARTAIARCRRGSRERPRAADPEYYRVEGLNELGRALLGQGRAEEALACFSEAVKARPFEPVPRHNLAVAYYAAGRPEAALEICNSLIGSVPWYLSPRLLRARIFEGVAKYREAIADYEWVLGRFAGSITAKAGLVWLRATVPEEKLRNGKQALELAKEVAAATGWRSVRAMDLLAAAYAELGDFEEAIRNAEKAFELWRLSEKDSLREQAFARAVTQGEIPFGESGPATVWSPAGIAERLTLY